MDLLGQTRIFGSRNGSKCIFPTIMFTKQLKTIPKPGLMGNISFQTRNRKIYLTMLRNSYGSACANMDFCVLKGVKMHISYNNVYKTA